MRQQHAHCIGLIAVRIYNFADKPERLAMSLPAFLNFASGLSHHLHMQWVHMIENAR